MCAIVAYVGPREAYPIILKGLKRLEYRGYDSAGVALLNHGMKVFKKKGRVSDLEESVVGEDMSGNIENYIQIKKELLAKGYEFKSDTDTEVLLNFIDDILKNNSDYNLEQALR